jgi:predicted transcriptional regulator
MMCMNTENIKRIRAFLDRPSVSQAFLATQADVHQNTLVGVTGDGWRPSAKTMRKLVAALDRLELVMS